MRIQNAFVVGWLLLVLLVPALPAFACVCSALPSFDESARKREVSVVVVGRILAVGGTADAKLYQADPTNVDVDVTWVAKGRVSATRVRIWNIWAGTSCGGALRPLRTGVQAVFALAPSDDMRRQSPELWEALKANVPSTDFVIATICGESLRELRSPEDVRKYVGKRIQ